jgi:hypothetical protein
VRLLCCLASLVCVCVGSTVPGGCAACESAGGSTGDTDKEPPSKTMAPLPNTNRGQGNSSDNRQRTMGCSGLTGKTQERKQTGGAERRRVGRYSTPFLGVCDCLLLFLRGRTRGKKTRGAGRRERRAGEGNGKEEDGRDKLVAQRGSKRTAGRRTATGADRTCSHRESKDRKRFLHHFHRESEAEMMTLNQMYSVIAPR